MFLFASCRRRYDGFVRAGCELVFREEGFGESADDTGTIIRDYFELFVELTLFLFRS